MGGFQSESAVARLRDDDPNEHDQCLRLHELMVDGCDRKSVMLGHDIDDGAQRGVEIRKFRARSIIVSCTYEVT
jgi:hypothetical protein